MIERADKLQLPAFREAPGRYAPVSPLLRDARERGELARVAENPELPALSPGQHELASPGRDALLDGLRDVPVVPPGVPAAVVELHVVCRPHEHQLFRRPVPVEAFPLELVPVDYGSVLRQLHPVVDAPSLEPVCFRLLEVLDELYAVPAVAFPVLFLSVAHFLFPIDTVRAQSRLHF